MGVERGWGLCVSKLVLSSMYSTTRFRVFFFGLKTVSAEPHFPRFLSLLEYFE